MIQLTGKSFSVLQGVAVAYPQISGRSCSCTTNQPSYWCSIVYLFDLFTANRDFDENNNDNLNLKEVSAGILNDYISDMLYSILC